MGVQIHQYADSVVIVEGIELKVSTRYPAEGEITIEVVKSPGRFELGLRIPAWASGATVDHAGDITAAEPGTFRMTADFAPGDIITLYLPT